MTVFCFLVTLWYITSHVYLVNDSYLHQSNATDNQQSIAQSFSPTYSLSKNQKNEQNAERTNMADMDGSFYLSETCLEPGIFVDGSIGIDCELRLWCHNFCCNSTVCERGLRYPAELYGRNPENTKTTFSSWGANSLSVVHKLLNWALWRYFTCTLPVSKIRQYYTH